MYILAKLFRTTADFIMTAFMVAFSVGLALLTIFGLLWAFFNWIQN